MRNLRNGCKRSISGGYSRSVTHSRVELAFCIDFSLSKIKVKVSDESNYLNYNLGFTSAFKVLFGPFDPIMFFFTPKNN